MVRSFPFQALVAAMELVKIVEGSLLLAFRRTLPLLLKCDRSIRNAGKGLMSVWNNFLNIL